ncbi:MAG: cytochrome c [Bacteroidetes bacterium]|nr:cytochrome c [Bacteroidota bacterium]MBS1634203.1 cytochrome c [Bacteroidota bacterium]
MKVIIFLILFTGYIAYSIVVYTRGTDSTIIYENKEKEQINKGKLLFQQYNCTSCHQLYGLGGYLGPELTTAISDVQRGELYVRAFLKNGGNRMPNFHFTNEEVDALVSFLKSVDTTAITYKRH